MSEQVYNCKNCPKRFTINPANGVCSETPSAPVVAPVFVKPKPKVSTGLVSAIVKLASIAAIIGMVSTCQTEAPASPAPVVKSHIAHKPIKHHAKRHHAKKKCQCECKKAIDKPIETAKVVILETPIEELSDGIS